MSAFKVLVVDEERDERAAPVSSHRPERPLMRDKDRDGTLLAVEGMPRRGGDAAGFTLLEVVIAVVLLVTGITALAMAFNLGLLASSDSESVQRALSIAQAHMEQVMNTDPDALASSGPAADATFSNYDVTVSVSGTNPKQVGVTVGWTPQGGQTSLSLNTQVADLD